MKFKELMRFLVITMILSSCNSDSFKLGSKNVTHPPTGPTGTKYTFEQIPDNSPVTSNDQWEVL